MIDLKRTPTVATVLAGVAAMTGCKNCTVSDKPHTPAQDVPAQELTAPGEGFTLLAVLAVVLYLARC